MKNKIRSRTDHQYNVLQQHNDLRKFSLLNHRVGRIMEDGELIGTSIFSFILFDGQELSIDFYLEH